MKTTIRLCVMICLCRLAVSSSLAQSTAGTHSFPAIGLTEQRQVDVAWNRFYDCAGIDVILKRLNRAFPDLTRRISLGQSVGGRTIWCLQVTALKHGDPDRKAGMYIDGNIHGNEVQGGDAVLYTAWYLCHQYGKLDKITQLLNERVFYLVPTINPDGRDSWLHKAHTAHSSRTGIAPTDNDRDGLIDEDDADDLNGDGQITQMRMADPHGRYKPHPDFPEALMVRVKPGEPGQYSLLGQEGIDNDQDGRINEDGPGGYDMNRNWAFDWQPDYVQRGAGDYPFCVPETRAVAQFVTARPNIAAAQSYHNTGGMILRGPGRAGGDMPSQDARVLATIADRGEQILPFYDSKIIHSDLYPAWGSELDWFYGARGVLCYSNEMWSRKNLYKTQEGASSEQNIEFMKYVLMEDGLIPWQPYDHPTYGPIEIGGTPKHWGRVPPSFLLEEELHRNMAFTLFHADMMPLVKVLDVTVGPLTDTLYEVWVTLENQRLMATRAQQDITNHISAPDRVRLDGDAVKVLSSGIVTDRFFRKIAPVRHHPASVKLDSVPGMGTARVQFVVAGRGDFTITYDSVKGGLLTVERTLE
ncbi:MAG: peptidase M14 [Planctomycetes bacterium]|nr:peptidase M14 [Planctomycetota bacterium]